jgi:hypothetical protein
MIDVTAPGRELHGRFVSLGEMTGKTANEIIAVVGQPTSISSMSAGRRLLQWQATGCHMALLFDADGRFVEITHQFAQYSPAPSGCMSVLVLLLCVLAGVGMYCVTAVAK